MNMERMNHANREDFPYLGRPNANFLIDARQVVGFSIDAHDVSYLHLDFLITRRAHAAVQDELTALYSLVRVSDLGGEEALRQCVRGSKRRGRLEAHHGLIFAVDAMFHHSSEPTELFIRTGLKRDRLAVC